MQLAMLCFTMMLGAGAPPTTPRTMICGDVGPDWMIAHNYGHQQAFDRDEVTGGSKAAETHQWENPCVMLDNNPNWNTQTVGKGEEITDNPPSNGQPSTQFLDMKDHVRVCP